MVNSKLVVEIHGQLKIGGGKKRVLLDWRENGNRRRRRRRKYHTNCQGMPSLNFLLWCSWAPGLLFCVNLFNELR
jgi:hypothetical protein